MRSNSRGTLSGTPQPVLSATGSLLLRPWETTDAAAYRDPEIQHWHTGQPGSEDQVHEWFERYRQDWAQEKGAHWAVTAAAAGVKCSDTSPWAAEEGTHWAATRDSGGEALRHIATGGRRSRALGGDPRQRR